MKTVLVACVLALVLALAIAPAASAGSASPPNYGNPDPTETGDCPPVEWGVEKCRPPLEDGESTHIVTDPLVAAGVDEDADGWVNFWCASTLGFQFHIGASGLDPRSTYPVIATGIQAAFATSDTPGAIFLPAEGIWILVSGSVYLDLGVMNTDANGLGSVRGVKSLEPSLYALVVEVLDADGHTVLDSQADDQAFFVY